MKIWIGGFKNKYFQPADVCEQLRLATATSWRHYACATIERRVQTIFTAWQGCFCSCFCYIYSNRHLYRLRLPYRFKFGAIFLHAVSSHLVNAKQIGYSVKAIEAFEFVPFFGGTESMLELANTANIRMPIIDAIYKLRKYIKYETIYLNECSWEWWFERRILSWTIYRKSLAL